MGRHGRTFKPHDHATETHTEADVIETRVNGEKLEAKGSDKSLLRFLREDLHLNGDEERPSKAQRCRACTVYLDGIAVMKRPFSPRGRIMRVWKRLRG